MKLTSQLVNLKKYIKSNIAQHVNTQTAKLSPKLHYYWLMPYIYGRNATLWMKDGKLISNGVAGVRGRHPGCCREVVLPLQSPFLAPSLPTQSRRVPPSLHCTSSTPAPTASIETSFPTATTTNIYTIQPHEWWLPPSPTAGARAAHVPGSTTAPLKMKV